MHVKCSRYLVWPWYQFGLTMVEKKNLNHPANGFYSYMSFLTLKTVKMATNWRRIFSLYNPYTGTPASLIIRSLENKKKKHIAYSCFPLFLTHFCTWKKFLEKKLEELASELLEFKWLKLALHNMHFIPTLLIEETELTMYLADFG